MKKPLSLMLLLAGVLILTGCSSSGPSSSSSPSSLSCDSACANYVAKCTEQIPNVTKEIQQETETSCQNECTQRSQEKINCIATSSSCELMTDQCGL